METEQLSWLFAAITAGWFGWMASQAGRSRALWAVGGGAFGLLASTIVLGLARASSIPYSEHDATLQRLKAILAAAALIFFIGWMLTAGLHRHTVLRRETKTGLPPVTTESEIKPPNVPPTKAAGRPPV